MGTIDCKQWKPLLQHSYTCHFLSHTTPRLKPMKDQAQSNLNQPEHPLNQYKQTQFTKITKANNNNQKKSRKD